MNDEGMLALLEGSSAPVETHTFYDKNVELFYNDEVHGYYRVDDFGNKLLVPGVTTILGSINKPALLWWGVGCAIDYVIDNYFTKPKIVRAAYLAAKDKQVFVDAVGAPAEVAKMDHAAVGQMLNQARLMHTKVSREAMDIGKEAHTWLEGLLKFAINKETKTITKALVDDYSTNSPFPDNETTTRCCTAAVDWMVKHSFTPILSEEKVYSLAYNYSGTLDWIGYVTSCGDPLCCKHSGTVKALGDFKSSKALYDEYRLQLAAYHGAVVEESPEHSDIEIHVVLRLGKEDGEFETLVITAQEFEADLDGFYGTLQMFVWFKQLDLIKKFNKPARVRKTAGTKKSTKVIKVPEREITPIPIG